MIQVKKIPPYRIYGVIVTITASDIVCHRLNLNVFIKKKI